MSFVEDMAVIVRTTPISNMDLAFIEKIDPMTAYNRLDESPDYKVLATTLLQLFDESVTKGVRRDRAAAVVLGAHEQIVRHVIEKALLARTQDFNVEALTVADIGHWRAEAQKQIDAVKKDLGLIQEVHRKAAENKTAEQFKAYVLYAAEKFAEGEEKTVLQAVAGRIIAKAKAKRS